MTPQELMGETFDIYAIESTKSSKEAYIGSAKGGYKLSYYQHVQDAKRGANTDKNIWLRSIIPDVRPVFIENVVGHSNVDRKKLEYILRYFKNGYGIINEFDPVTRGDLPLCILRSIRLAYDRDPYYSNFYNYRDLGLKYRKCCGKNSYYYVDNMDRSLETVEQLYKQYSIPT